MEKKKPVDKTIYKGPKKAANKVPKETKLVAKKDIATKPLEKEEVKPVHEPIKIKMNSTLTENSTILDEQLIEWEGDNLNKILSRCVKLACSIAPNKLYDYQVKPMRRIFKSVLTNDGANLTLLFARQAGKSEVTAVTIATLLIIAPLLSRMFPTKFPYFKHGIMIGMFAPTAEQCSTTHARIELVLSHDASNALLVDPDVRAKKRYDSGVIEVKGDLKKINGREEAGWTSFVRFQTGAKQAKIESKSYHIIFSDECVTGDAVIELREGKKRLKDVCVGDYVLSHDVETNTKCLSKVLNKWDKGARATYKITTTSGKSIKCTAEHKIYTQHGWVTAEDILIGGSEYSVLVTTETGWYLEPVKSVKYSGVQKVYDIETANTHTFYANGILVHNCQEIDDSKLTKSILPMLAAYNGTSVYTGTPSTQICEFYNAILRNRTVDIKKNDPNDHNHFEYDYKTVQLYNPRYKQFIKNTIERMGENSDSFQMSYALKWLIEKGMALTSQDYSNYLAKSDLEIEMFPSGGSQYVAGLDLGKGKDCSILTIFRVQKTGDGKIVKTVARWEELSNVSWRAQYNEILQWVNTYGILALAVDATGKGDPICEELAEYLEDTDCVVYPVNFNLKSKNELAVSFYEDMYQGNIIVPSGARTRAIKQYTTFYSQFLSAVKTYNKGLVQIEHPPEVAGASDDYVDSFLLGLFAAKKAIVYEVRQEMNPLYGPKSKNGEDIYRKVYETHRIRINDLFAR